MPISSSAVFHFTRTKAALKGILTDDFKIKYCLETQCFETTNNQNLYPMVSFCDIPLSQVKEHLGKYGSYGIGLTKEWATSQCLSPVQYVAAGSNQASSLKALINAALPDESSETEDETDMQRAVYEVGAYIKNYEGDLVRGGRTTKGYRFYDEREWRYVPSSDGSFPVGVSGKGGQVSKWKATLNRLIADLRLMFKPADIKYIIVRSESDISEFIEVIRSAKGKSYSLSETERLTTRIITREQIECDL